MYLKTKGSKDIRTQIFINGGGGSGHPLFLQKCVPIYHYMNMGTTSQFSVYLCVLLFKKEDS